MSRLCEQTREMLSLYIDDMLSETEKETVQSHLAECEACREDYEMLLAVKQSMADMPQLEVSDRFRTGLHEKLVAEAAKKTSSAPARRPLWYRLSGAAAAVAVIAVSVIALNNVPKQADLTPKTMTPEPTQQAAATPGSTPAAENGTETDAAPDGTKAPKAVQTNQNASKQDTEPQKQTQQPTPADKKADETSYAAADTAGSTDDTSAEKKQESTAPQPEQAAVASAYAPDAANNRADAADNGLDTQTFAAAASDVKEDANTDAMPIQRGGDSGGGGSSAGSASKASAAMQHKLRFTLTEQGCRQAHEVLQGYTKNGDAYLVPENKAAQIAQKLKQIGGYQSCDEEGTAISGGYVWIELTESA